MHSAGDWEVALQTSNKYPLLVISGVDAPSLLQAYHCKILSLARFHGQIFSISSIKEEIGSWGCASQPEWERRSCNGTTKWISRTNFDVHIKLK
jgi:hypothetical protein